jgi:hypothetical protein
MKSSPSIINDLLQVTKRDRNHFNVSSNLLLLSNTTVHTQVIDTRPLYSAWTSVQQVCWLAETQLAKIATAASSSLAASTVEAQTLILEQGRVTDEKILGAAFDFENRCVEGRIVAGDQQQQR